MYNKTYLTEQIVLREIVFKIQTRVNQNATWWNAEYFLIRKSLMLTVA